jgi:hypothetical protein
MKMNKTILVSFFALFILAFSVSAWHCTDTDASKPKQVTTVYGTVGYGIWGDNGLLNGTAAGWSADGKAPEGCTGTQGNYKCIDHCDGSTLVEYYCGDWVHNVSKTVKVCKNETYQDCNWVGQGQNRHKVCTDKVKVVCENKKVNVLGTTGETVIFSKFFKDSKECGAEVPEFGPIAAGVAAVGAIAGLVIIRRKN